MRSRWIPYATTPARLLRQLVSDIVMITWAAIWVWVGSAVYSAPQLKGMQEVITLLVFAVFSAFYLGQPLKWNHYAAFGLIVVAAFLMFKE